MQASLTQTHAHTHAHRTRMHTHIHTHTHTHTIYIEVVLSKWFQTFSKFNVAFQINFSQIYKCEKYYQAMMYKTKLYVNSY